MGDTKHLGKHANKLAGSLEVTGKTTLKYVLSVSGAATFDETLTVGGATTLKESLTVEENKETKLGGKLSVLPHLAQGCERPLLPGMRARS